MMDYNVMIKKGKLQIEKALMNMNWDTARFESELELFSRNLPSRTQHRLWKQYVDWMQECGCPMELVQVGERKRRA